MLTPEDKIKLEAAYGLPFEKIEEHIQSLLKQHAEIAYTADEIRAIRKANGMSRKEFGAAVGVRARTVEQWEQGLRRPSRSARKLIAMITER